MRLRKVEEKRSNYRKTLLALVVLTSCSLSGLLYRESRRNAQFSATEMAPLFLSRKDTADYKRIVIWTRWNGETLSYSPNRQPGWLGGCPESRCLIVTSRSHHQTADAILFSMPDFINLNDRPHDYARKSFQLYVFFLDESPDTTKELMPWNYWSELGRGFFNLTMSYRSDSDLGSASYLEGYQPHIINLTGRDPLWFQGKRDVLWLVSHCRTASKREDYARQLSHYLEVDQFGNCDTPDPCKLKQNCNMDTLLSKYKFYLSFENSFCKDYVTEKLTRALNNDVVPVVLGGANYSSFLPESAFINIEDFESPKELADYLKILMKNETMYERHLAWKYPGQPVWKIPGIGQRKNSRFCKLCEMLHRPKETKILKVYPQIEKWWFEGQCREPRVKFKVSRNIPKNLTLPESNESNE